VQIAEIHIYRQDLPVVGPPYRMSHSEVTALDTTIVEVITDTGLCGFGETCPVGPTYAEAHAQGARAALSEIAPHLIGLDPLTIGTVARHMDRALTGHMYAKAAIDIALWDIAGKAHGMRVCDLLGGAARDNVPSYYAISVGDAEEVAEAARLKQDEGFDRLQLKVGGRDVEHDIEVVRKVFEVRRPGVRVALDANRALTTREAVLLSRACADLPFVLEQPCATYEEIQAIKPQVCHPVYLDENMVDLNAIMRAVHDGVADGFGMKVTRVGGLSPMRTIREICQATRRPMSCDDSWGGDIIAAACVHMGATIDPQLSEGVWIAAPYIENHYDRENGVRIVDGWIDVPSGPGLGISPDTSRWQAHHSVS
jgi:L-alanine-DL-glutamate epimerase-like enolase superfamily enzyme